MRRLKPGSLAPVLLCLLLPGCQPAPSDTDRSTTPGVRYSPRGRDLTVTTVPLLVKEMRPVLPFLPRDFAPGGVLEGKEVYAFMPSTLTVGQGDTVHWTFINPEDDVHSFLLPGLAVPLPGQTITHASYVADRAGILSFTCSVPTHLPMMHGELVVLPAESMRRMEAPGGRAPAGRGDPLR